MIKLVLAALALVVPGMAFAQTGTAAAPPPQGAAWQDEQAAAIARLKTSDGWQPLPGGKGRWRRTKGEGSGPHPTTTDTVRVTFVGRFTDGAIFQRLDAPIEGPISEMIDGLQIALPMAGVGDTIEVALPADLAYGQGVGPIPAGATLFFTVDVLGIVK